MKTSRLRIISVTVGVSIFAAVTSATAGAPKDEIPRAVKIQQQQLQSIARQLVKVHGDDAWYVFRVVGFRPNEQHTITHITNGVWRRAYATSTVTSQLESKAFKVDGPTAAAQMIWCGDRSPVRYVYWTFKNEHDADAFYRSLQY